MYINKESELIEILSKEEIDYIRDTNININTDIVELLDQLEDLMQKKGIETKEGLIVESIIDKLSTIYVDNYYRIIFVKDNLNNIYYCISKLNNFEIGQEVLIEKDNTKVIGIVKEVAYYKKENLPILEEELYLINTK